MSIRTRFAPSPTGYLHIGGARTALYCWLQTRHSGGEFVLRIEDTDRERSTEAAVQVILDGMDWMGLDADEGPIYQTERFDRYRQVLGQLLADGHAYHCYCTREELDERRAEQIERKANPRYDGRCRHRTEPREGVSPVVRFKNPSDGDVVVNDLVRGRVIISNGELDDLIIARSDGTPTYNFTVVVDDIDMRITHVVRGDDHMINTPRQINIMRALGADVPVYAHLPMILGPDGAKLSKRHGAVSVLEYREQGYLPEALLNYLVRLGWAHGDQEIFSVDEMVSLFDIKDVNKSASRFDPEKLNWVNQQHIMAADEERLAGLLAEQLEGLGIDPAGGPELVAVVGALKERAQTMRTMAETSEYFFREFEDYEEKAARKHLRPVAAEPLARVRAALAALPEWTRTGVHEAVEQTAEALELKLGKVAQPLRVAVSGRAATPGIDVTLELVGRERTLSRLDRALEYIAARVAAG